MKEHHKKIEREKEVVDGKRPASGDLEENHGNKKQKTAENHENEKQKTAIPDATLNRRPSMAISLLSDNGANPCWPVSML